MTVTAKNDRILVTTSVKGRKKTEIWDTSSPHGIGYPFRWVMERTPQGVVIMDLSARTDEVKSGGNFHIGNDSLAAGASVELPPQFSVQLKSVHPVKPAYLTEGEDTAVVGKTGVMPALLGFSGVRRTVLSCQRIHSAYVAYSRGRPIFTVYHEANGIRVKPLINGVFVKIKNQAPARGTSGESWHIPNEQISNATIVRGWYWWRFNFITPIQATTDGATVTRSRDDAETKWFYRAIGVLSALMLALTLVTWLRPAQVKPKKDTPAPQIVKFRPPKVNKAQVQTERPEQTPALVQRPEIGHKEAKRGVEDPQKLRQKEKMQKLREARAKAQAKKLREALGGALAMMQKGALKGREKMEKPKSSEFFGGGGSAIAPTDIKPGFVGSGARVGAIGGKAVSGGAGYASGDHGVITGQGNAFVSMEAGGSYVEEGLTKDEVGAVIHKHMSEIRYCYDNAMVRQPSIEGKLVVKFTIDPRGGVKTAAVQSSTVNEKHLGDCIVSRLVTWKFPHPKGGISVTVSYPFLFKTLGRE